MELIDRRALPWEQQELDQYGNWTLKAEYIDSAPTISAVPVVRCQECKRWYADPDSYGKDDGPKGKCMKSFEDTYSDDFCSYGQRKIETVLPINDAKDESLEG